MSWTEERVERLGRLWMEGRSASVIAAELGEGVTRNAVIGKIHRLGLANRSPASDEPERLKLKLVAKAPPPVAPPPAPQTDEDDGAAPARDVVIPFSSRVTIMELRETMCRWPLGDPASAEFRYCGCRTAGAIPYCAEHARVAFQPIAERRRVERMARIA